MWIYLIVFLFSSFLFYIAAKREKKWNVTAFFAILIRRPPVPIDKSRKPANSDGINIAKKAVTFHFFSLFAAI